MFRTNLILDTDSYKFSHYKQYPPNTTFNYSYFESRGGDYSHTVFFGLQYYLKEYLSKPITEDDVYEAKLLAEAHGTPFNLKGWSRVITKHGGFLPIKIQAVPEGSVVPVKNVLMTIENTDPELAWITSYVETMLARVWYPITVATRSWACRRIIKKYLDMTCDKPEDEIDFKLHDFGSRGSTSQEAAAIGGAAHLLSFLGTDTVVALKFLQDYYGAEGASGFSIPAAEHSTMSAWGRDGEIDAYRNMIKQYGDGPIMAVVSDTWNIFEAAENIWGGELKAEVLNMNAMLVIRPDSGDPVDVPVKLVKILDKKFGSQLNTKGYKVLDNVRVIQGDGMDQEQIRAVYKALEAEGYSAENLAVGMGAGLLQNLNRDTCSFAYKTSYMIIDGKGVDIYKDPITDPGKKSKRGRLALVYLQGEYKTVSGTNVYGDILETVWQDGELLVDQKLEDVRMRAQRDYVRI